MDVREISHVEIYTGDAIQAAYYYRNAFGFRVVAEAGPETGLPGRRSILLEQGRARLLLTSALHADDPIAKHVARHGDGVKDIALRVPDVMSTYRDAVAGGAVPVTEPVTLPDGGERAVLATFGEVVHSLLPAGTDQPFPLPELRPVEPVADPDAEPDAEPLLRLIDHIAVCVPAGGLDKVTDLYERVLDFEGAFEEYIEVGNQAMDSRVVRSRSGLLTLTVLEPDARREPGQIDAFLQRYGDAGVQHLAFDTVDIETAVRRLTRRGVRFLSTPASYYDALPGRVGPLGKDLDGLRANNILADRDDRGLLFQIFTRSPYARGTMFLELIERRGAQTFGSGNIKALYEAVERDQATPEAAESRR
jgi:4-hydroxymandelate synthase